MSDYSPVRVPQPPAPPLPAVVQQALDLLSKLPTKEEVAIAISDAISSSDPTQVQQLIEQATTDLVRKDALSAAVTSTAQPLISSAIQPILTLVGVEGGDVDTVVSNLREALKVLEDFPEATKLIVRLANIDAAIANALQVATKTTSLVNLPLVYDQANPSTSKFKVEVALDAVSGEYYATSIDINDAYLLGRAVGSYDGSTNKLSLTLAPGLTPLVIPITAAGGTSGGSTTPTPSTSYPSLTGAKSYITSFENGQTPFKGYRTLTYGTSAYGVYYQGAAETWGGGNNTGMVKDKIPAGTAAAIAWDLPADGLLGGQSTGVAISDSLTDYFRGYYSTPITLGIYNGKFQWYINGQETISTIAVPTSGPNTIVVIDVPASGNITARYTTDGSTWTVIAGFSVARPAMDLGVAPFIEQTARIYNFRATNLQPF